MKQESNSGTNLNTNFIYFNFCHRHCPVFGLRHVIFVPSGHSQKCECSKFNYARMSEPSWILHEMPHPNAYRRTTTAISLSAPLSLLLLTLYDMFIWKCRGVMWIICDDEKAKNYLTLSMQTPSKNIFHKILIILSVTNHNIVAFCQTSH